MTQLGMPALGGEMRIRGDGDATSRARRRFRAVDELSQLIDREEG
jgi:hypothetical protein